ncbi:RNA-dependent RNA polymerase [Pythium ultimum RNA virus 1]|nr:RNA-dependent RNA polymerase [Pythium ultimum RNA virus 1]
MTAMKSYTRETRNGPRSFPQDSESHILAIADVDRPDECGRVIGDVDPPATGYSMCRKLKSILLTGKLDPELGRYLYRCKLVAQNSLQWLGCQLVRFGIWFQGFSGPLVSRVVAWFTEPSIIQNVEEIVEEEGARGDIKFEDDWSSDDDQPMTPASSVTSSIFHEGSFEERDEHCCDSDTSEGIGLKPMTTELRANLTDVEIAMQLKSDIAERVQMGRPTIIDGFIMPDRFEDVTLKMAEDPSNPFGLEFFKETFHKFTGANLEFSGTRHDLFWRTNEGRRMLNIARHGVHDKMPVDVTDVKEWVDVALALLTGQLDRTRLNEDDISWAINAPSDDHLDYDIGPAGLSPRLRKRSLEIQKELKVSGFCWTLLFKDTALDPQLREMPPIITKHELCRLVESGSQLRTDIKFSLKEVDGLFHVGGDGTLNAMEVINLLPWSWSRMGYDLVSPTDMNKFVALLTTKRFNSLDELVKFVTDNLTMLSFSLIDFKRELMFALTQLWYVRWLMSTIMWAWIGTRMFCTGLFMTIYTLYVMVATMVGLFVPNRLKTRMNIWFAINLVNLVCIVIRSMIKTTMPELLVVGSIVGLLLVSMFPLLCGILIVCAMVAGTISMISLKRSGVIEAVFNVSSTLVHQLLVWVANGPLKGVLKFVIHARITMWIKHERPLRGQVLETVMVKDNIVRVTDRYNAPEDVDEIASVLMALCWSTFGKFGLSIVFAMFSTWILSVFVVGAIRLGFKTGKGLLTVIKVSIGTLTIVALMPDSGVDTVSYAVLYINELRKALLHEMSANFSVLWTLVEEKFSTLRKFRISRTPYEVDGLETHMSLPDLNIALFRHKTISVLRYNIVRFAVAVENVELPKLIMTQYTAPSPQTLKESLEILKEIGWPVNVEISDSKLSKTSALQGFNEWFMANTNFCQPLRNIRTMVSEETHLFDFFKPPEFRHTGTYTSVNAEVKSTARYYKNNVTEGDIDVEDDVWELLHEHFESSRLARTALVVNKLIKKYSVGFGFMDPIRKKTMTRKVLMSLIGGEKEFVRLFDLTLANIGRIVPVAHVFTKFETLKESKWMNDMVRTIVGVPLAHYANTSKFSYMQNLRHPFENSPIKVGMPLTGAWFADIWNDHSKRKNHFNGDLKLADSSYSREIFDVIKACRKRGFSSHKDYAQICNMIDIAYDQLMTMPLAYKSTGEVTYKGDGGATGQGNTSVDNSVALVVLYLASWRRITGKSVKEFNLYNTLSNQADDHILSWDPNDFGWNPNAWMKEFSKLGVTLTNESNSNELHEASFLAKRIVLDHQTEAAKLEKYGIKPPRFMTCHDKNRLLGKIAAPQPLRDHQARARRLLSYLYLTAHHEDVYRVTVNAIRRLQAKSRRDLGVKVPPYKAIMRAWYTRKVKEGVSDRSKAEEEVLDYMSQALDEFGDVRDVVHVSEPKSLEVVLICMSMLPQVFSARFMTSPALRHIHKLLGDRVAWPIELLRRRNSMLQTPGAIATALIKTNYEFINGIDMSCVRSSKTDTGLLVSHWVFTFLQWALLGGNGPKGLNLLLRSVDNLIANAYYVLFGQISDVVEAVGFGYLDTMLLVWCDLIPDLFPALELQKIPLVIPSDILTRMIARMWRSVQPSSGIDFEAIELLLSRPGFFGSNFVIKAPTGVGKSTRMVAKIAALTNKRRILVVEPRHILVLGLTDYMNKIDPNTGYGASTTGRTPSIHDRVIYCTYQSLVLSGFGCDNDIVIVDEAHIKDPVYSFAVQDLCSRGCTTLLVTATPDPSWDHLEMEQIELKVAPLWRVVRHDIKITSITAYKKQVIKMVRNLSSSDKVLIFMPTTRQCAEMLKELPGHGCIISSKHPLIDETAQFFVSTRVSDAGLTLPDVSFVFSMDIEWGVSSTIYDDNIFGPMPLTGHYRLDSLTIKQRQGRTGRTCDGTFFLFEVGGEYYPRQTTPKDLLDELSQLLDLPHIENKLPTEAAELWDKYKEMALMLGGDLTPQSLLPDPSHYRDPSQYRRANNQLSFMYGQSTTNPITSFDPLRGKNMLPGRVLTDRGDPVVVNVEDEDHLEAMDFWNLSIDTNPVTAIDNAVRRQVVQDFNPDSVEETYHAPYDFELEEEETKESS